MGNNIGLIIFQKASVLSHAARMHNLSSFASHLGTATGAEAAWQLEESQALIGTTEDKIVVVSKSLAYALIARPDFLPPSDAENWIVQEAQQGDILIAFQHSVAGIHGHILFHQGKRVGSQFCMDGVSESAKLPAHYPDWYHGPTTCQEDQTNQVIEGFTNSTLTQLLANVPKWERYAV